MTVVLVVLAAMILNVAFRQFRKRRYFASEEFSAHKNEIAAVIADHNEVAQYTSEILSRGSFQLGASSTGVQAHLASFQNTSNYNYRRNRNVANYQARNVHNCSLQVVRNASADPLKYVSKYFNISADEANLADVERLGEDIARLEDAINNLRQRETSIAESFNPPKFILKHYRDEFMQHVGVKLSPISVPYPVYVFEYVSAGGNSSQRATVTFNTPTIDALIETLSQRIRFKKSAAGQRALMTARLRSSIKARDNHTCRYCLVSLAAEPHLLLEVDHIIPVSKGGLSTPDNLQTLCWRCNRSKANKVPYAGEVNSSGQSSNRNSALLSNASVRRVPSTGVAPMSSDPGETGPEVQEAQRLSQQYFDLSTDEFFEVARRIMDQRGKSALPVLEPELSRVERVIQRISAGSLPLSEFTASVDEINQSRERLVSIFG
ncbi:HNH endonuclease [Geodermatophilus sp. CPCC 205506]|uniref:HNH endonuclease n=1 Tax=Geodermatophilus sp. CPCC 205506 TaxID=2936596 RepID=UPI003EEFABAE